MLFEQALDLPCAHGGPAGTGRIRAVPEDFVVKEWLGFAADGEGDHWLLRVLKRGANTQWVAKELAKAGRISPRDVGFAGLKDREAVAEQAFTVPVRSAVSDWAQIAGDGFRVLAATRHRRKLKRGALRGNAFEIRVRDWQGDRDVLQARLQQIRAGGVPNYFGPQRFGRDGHNLSVAHAWFAQGVAPVDRFERSFALSAARSALFNAVLAARVAQRTWNRLLPGEIVNLDGSGSIFVPEAIDSVLQERCERLDVHPTAPLWGLAEKPATGDVGALEQHIAQHHAVLADGLCALKVEAERRATRAVVADLQWDIADDAIELKFRLPRGSFATAVLHELIAGVFAVTGADAWAAEV